MAATTRRHKNSCCLPGCSDPQDCDHCRCGSQVCQGLCGRKRKKGKAKCRRCSSHDGHGQPCCKPLGALSCCPECHELDCRDHGYCLCRKCGGCGRKRSSSGPHLACAPCRSRGGCPCPLKNVIMDSQGFSHTTAVSSLEQEPEDEEPVLFFARDGKAKRRRGEDYHGITRKKRSTPTGGGDESASQNNRKEPAGPGEECKETVAKYHRKPEDDKGEEQQSSEEMKGQGQELDASPTMGPPQATSSRAMTTRRKSKEKPPIPSADAMATVEENAGAAMEDSPTAAAAKGLSSSTPSTPPPEPAAAITTAPSLQPQEPEMGEYGLWNQGDISAMKSMLREPFVEDQASAAVLAVSRKKVAKKKFVEYGCVSCLEVWSEDVEEGKDTEMCFIGVAPEDMDDELESAQICLTVLRRHAPFFSQLGGQGSPQDFSKPRRIIVEYVPSQHSWGCGSGGAAQFATLFCTLTGAKLKPLHALVGVVTLRGKITEVDLTSLFLQLYAGYQVDLTVVLPLCHRRHVQERLEKGGVGWLEAMVQGGRLKYADDVLELLHHCIEGLDEKILSRYKANLDRGVSFALAATTSPSYGGPFLQRWVEMTAVAPGTGKIRSMMTIRDMARRASILLEHLSPLLPQEEFVIDPRHLTKNTKKGKVKVDLVVHTSSAPQYGMELGVLVALLGLVLGRAPKNTDVFIGVLCGRGGFYYGTSTAPPIDLPDIYAMRRAGIKRLFLGKNMDEDHLLDMLMVAGTAEAEGCLEHLTIIILKDYHQLAEYVPGGPKSIFGPRMGDEPQVEEEEEEAAAMASKGEADKPKGWMATAKDALCNMFGAGHH